MTKENPKEFFKSYTGRGVGKLFIETIVSNEGTFTPIFNMTEEDTDTTWSFKRLYIKHYKDPTEVSFVDSVLCGRFDLLKGMSEHKMLKDFIKTLREEAHARFLADTYKSIKEIADVSDAKTAIGALKFLCTSVKGSDEVGTGRGRPSKKEIQQRTNEILSEDKEIQEAFARVQSYC